MPTTPSNLDIFSRKYDAQAASNNLPGTQRLIRALNIVLFFRMSRKKIYKNAAMNMRAILAMALAFMLTPALQSHGQVADEWNVPWTILGDSSGVADKNSLVVITGRITDVNSSKPIQGALISADFLKHYDYSDENGYYVLELPPGSYRIKIKQLGMLPVYVRAKIFSNEALNISMQEGVVQLTEVLITSRPIDSNVKQSVAGLTRLNVQEIKTLPTLMGEIDIVKSLQLMPGVSSVGEGSSGINVRGGRVDQNLVLFNDVPLFNTSHALGFVSAFNQDVIDNFSLYKGNVPAQFGGRASSVIDINTRRGDFEEWIFQGGVGPVSSRFAVEGPLVNKRSSVLLAGRVSHANWALARVADPDVRKSEVLFNDGFIGLSHRFNENSTADVTAYASHDNFRFSDRFGFRWNNYLVNARWQSRADKKMSPLLSASFGHFKNTLFEPSGVAASSIENAMNYFHLKETLNYIPTERHDIRGGISAIGYFPRNEMKTGYDANPLVTTKQSGKSSGLEWAVFLNDDFEWTENISLSAGLRYSHYFHLGPDTTYRYAPGERLASRIADTLYHSQGSVIKSFNGFEPRLSIRVNLRDNQSLKAGYNRMIQYIHLISNTTAPTPVDVWQVSTVHTPPQLADNYSLGYFWNLKDNLWETSAELFYKDMHNLVEYKDFAELLLNDHIETELLSGKGRAWGAELFIRRLKGRWTGWLSYTFSRTEVMVSSPVESESVNDGEWFPSNYHKPHTLNLVLNKQLGRQGAFSLVFSYNTGRPFTAIESSYVSGGTVVPVYSHRNQHTIPNYWRADLSITIGNVLKKVDDSLVVSLYNVFGRENAYSVFYQRPSSNFFIPKPYKLSVLGAVLPSLTYNFRF